MRKPLILKGSRLICPFSTVHTEREPLKGCEQVSGKKSQHKGRAGELELSRILRGCGYDVQPGRAVSYGATPDISGLPGIHIEVKRVERLNVPEAMKQAVRDAEKLVDLMDTQGGCITICSAEGGVFDSMAGRYEKGTNFDVYLKGHAGDMIVVDRIGRRTNSIPDPRLTMLLTFQPDVLSGLMGNTTFRGRGLCGRFLYAMCKSKVGHRAISPVPVPDRVRGEYRAFVRRILSTQWSGTIHLSPEADEIRREYQGYIEKKLGDDWENMRDWGGKLTGAMVRIAALMHAAEAQGDPTETPISLEVMAGATSIAEFLSAHAVAAYQIMGADEEYESARYLWRRISGTGREEMSKRDLFNICKGRFKRVEDMEPALQTLVNMGYIREIEIATGGRPTKKLFVNPKSKSSKSSKRGRLDGR